MIAMKDLNERFLLAPYDAPGGVLFGTGTKSQNVLTSRLSSDIRELSRHALDDSPQVVLSVWHSSELTKSGYQFDPNMDRGRDARLSVRLRHSAYVLQADGQHRSIDNGAR